MPPKSSRSHFREGGGHDAFASCALRFLGGRQELRKIPPVLDCKVSPSTVTDVENLDSLLSFEDTIDDAIDMRLVSVKKVPQSLVLRSHGAPVGMFFQT
jgi:hypothetical protein